VDCDALFIGRYISPHALCLDRMAGVTSVGLTLETRLINVCLCHRANTKSQHGSLDSLTLPTSANPARSRRSFFVVFSSLTCISIYVSAVAFFATYPACQWLRTNLPIPERMTTASDRHRHTHARHALVCLLIRLLFIITWCCE